MASPYIDDDTNPAINSFIDSVNSHDQWTLEHLADDFNKLSPKHHSTSGTVATDITESLFNYLYSLAAEKDNDTTEIQKLSPVFLKQRFGDQLLIENQGLC